MILGFSAYETVRYQEREGYTDSETEEDCARKRNWYGIKKSEKEKERKRARKRELKFTMAPKASLAKKNCFYNDNLFVKIVTVNGPEN